MRYDVVTIFPEYLEPLKLFLLGKAREKGLVDLHLHDLGSGAGRGACRLPAERFRRLY